MRVRNISSHFTLTELLEAAIYYGMGVHAMGGRTANLFTDRAEAFIELKKARFAKRDCDKALEQNSTFARAFKVRGKALILLGQFEKGHKDLETAAELEKNPQQPSITLPPAAAPQPSNESVSYKSDKTWITPELLGKIAKDKELSEAFNNPKYAEIITQVCFVVMHYFV